MQKQIVLSLLVIVAIVMLISGATFALLVDTEASTGNTFTATNLDLKIRDGGVDWQDGITEVEWGSSDWKPGFTEYGHIDMRNFGPLYGDHMEITCDYTVDDPPGPESDTNNATTGDEMASQMKIIKMEYEYDSIYINCLPLINDNPAGGGNGNGYADLYDLKHAGLDNLNLIHTPPQVQDADLAMTIQFNPSAGNDFQGDIFDLTMIFTLNQDASQ